MDRPTRASRRLWFPARLTAKLAPMCGAAAALAIAGAPVWALVFFAISVPLVIAGELRERTAGSS